MIKKVIEIDVDQVQAMGGLDALQQSLAETENKSESLKAELRKLKQQLAELPEGSEEYNKIAQRAGEVSDKIGDINTRIKNLGSDTKNIDAVVQGAQALSGAFSVATSASALFGEENKELQETMVKVESAIGLTVGIQSIANALQKESALSIGLANVATKIQIGLQTAYATVVGTTTGALKALRVALVSTGVGALVVALGFLISKMTESTEATEDQEQALKNLTDAQKAYNESLKSEIDGIQNSTQLRILRAKVAGKSEKELRDIERQGEQERVQVIDAEIKRIDRELQNRKLSAEQFKFLQEERNKLSDQSLKLAQERDIRQLEFEADVADKRRDAESKASEKSREILKQRKKDLEEYNKSVLQGLNELQSAIFNSEIEQRVDIQKQANEILKSLEPEETALQKLTREFEEKKQILELANQSTLELQSQFIADSEALEEEARQKQREADEKELERKRILKEQELALVGDTLGKISFLLGKNSKAGKAFAIAQALINTYQGITAELATKALTPYEIGLKVVNVAYIAKTGFDAVKKIASTSTSGSGGSGGSQSLGGGGSASATPQFNLVGQSSTNQLTATIAGQQNRPVQTYVVGSQVTSQQALDRNAQQASVFG